MFSLLLAPGITWNPCFPAAREEDASRDFHESAPAGAPLQSVEGWRVVAAPDLPGGRALATDVLPGTYLEWKPVGGGGGDAPQGRAQLNLAAAPRRVATLLNI